MSNLDVDDLDELVALPDGEHVATDQILYNLARRGPEWDLLPWASASGLPLMAYSPIEQGRLLSDATLAEVARRHDATPAQVALAWVLDRPGVLAIGEGEHPGTHGREPGRARRHAVRRRPGRTRRRVPAAGPQAPAGDPVSAATSCCASRARAW